jgi:hypothetical protein
MFSSLFQPCSSFSQATSLLAVRLIAFFRLLKQNSILIKAACRRIAPRNDKEMDILKIFHVKRFVTARAGAATILNANGLFAPNRDFLPGGRQMGTLSVDAYIAKTPKRSAQQAEELRRAIKSVAPNALWIGDCGQDGWAAQCRRLSLRIVSDNACYRYLS